MIHYLSKDILIQAIKNNDANYIKNCYFYHKTEYLALCRATAVIAAFIEAEHNLLRHFNDRALEFWRTIYCINSNEARGKENEMRIDLSKLPECFVQIIQHTNHMNNTYLEDYTPLWMTSKNLSIIGSFICSTIIGGFSILKLSNHFEVPKLCSAYSKLLMHKLCDIYQDPQKRMVGIYALSACASISIVLTLLSKDNTKEAFTNFVDWGSYKCRMLVGREQPIEIL